MAAVVIVIVAPAADASSCLRVGVYEDAPLRSLPALTRTVGPGVRVVSTYVTAGRPVDPRLVAMAQRRKLTLIVTWDPDGGADGPNQPRFRLRLIARGKLDVGLRALVRQLAPLGKRAILRPMPEPNTPWYAWSGLANTNRPADYVAAWRHVRRVVRKAGGLRLRMLWSPYARSIPDQATNAIRAYFPGASQVDLVGADAYNYGNIADLTWSDPSTLFSAAYGTIEGLAAKPFWIAETGSTAVGGDKASWILSLRGLKNAMPRLDGLVWLDTKDPNGDFRIRQSAATRAAFKTLLKGACR